MHHWFPFLFSSSATSALYGDRNLSARPSAAAEWRSVHAATALALLLGLMGCRSAPPVVTRNDGSFVTITQPRGDPQREAKQLADQTCGKHAMLLSKLCTDPKCDREELKFWCK
jgi:hypothetical protein